METTTSALMTEQQFISMFKEKGFELYKTEELKKQIQDRDKTTDEQSLRLINLFDAYGVHDPSSLLADLTDIITLNYNNNSK